jgi:3-methyladenine DNA glycosylase AlkD
MTFDDVMAALEAAGSEQTRKTYRRHGMPDPMFGVSFAKLGELKKRIKVNQALADELWASGNVDARFLATMIADPRLQSPGSLEAWASGAGCHTLAGYVAELAMKTPFGRELAEGWIDRDEEMVQRCGWTVMAYVAMNDKTLDVSYFEPLLVRIERDVHGAKNRAREGMYNALLAIGIRDEACEGLAIAAARRIGKVTIDHGDTACKTPDAEPYILKGRAHAKQKAARAAAKKAAK